ncbi:hypothetical protein EV189_0244 [Motilibacter rhizosphaerae]|uniref:DUF6458 domain-containing protein n=1 Tax=Motilibacter rhizosphaerae TaxID=598652 RepID=A0A4Q7NUX1_9ACTN|nr:DUF6458 family protein [Motilibacter rhizosphaerae]RZS91013.1 hypothetical protein EV189_0244 [Motilibacter rhizosphaerae]
MGIGISVLLIAAGLILALAVEATVSGLDIQVVGWILVAAGVLGLVLEIALFAPRRRYPARDVVEVARPADRVVVDDRPVVEERRVYGDGRY